MARLLLINLPILKFYSSGDSLRSTYNPPLGLLYLASNATLFGHSVKTLDLSMEHMRIVELMQFIGEYKPDAVGFSILTENVNEAFRICRGIKKKYPNIITILGGPHASLEPLYSIQNTYVDFLVVYEGESAIIELLEAIDSKGKVISRKNIRGIVYKEENNKIVRDLSRHDICDLDLQPLPKHNKEDLHKYGSIINLITSRGCPGNCIYCAATALSGARYRTRAISNTILEIVYLIDIFKDHMEVAYFQDDTFTAISDRVYEFIRIKKQLKLDFSWRCESRVDVVTEDMVKAMAESNCLGVAYGVESGSQEVLDKIHKQIELKKVEQVVKWNHENHIYTSLNFMLGHYCDTCETMDMTKKFIERMVDTYKVGVFVTYNTPFPGTRQYSQRDKLGIRLIKNDYSEYTLFTPSIEGNDFTAEDQSTVYRQLSKIIGSNNYGLNIDEGG